MSTTADLNHSSKCFLCLYKYYTAMFLILMMYCLEMPLNCFIIQICWVFFYFDVLPFLYVMFIDDISINRHCVYRNNKMFNIPNNAPDIKLSIGKSIAQSKVISAVLLYYSNCITLCLTPAHASLLPDSVRGFILLWRGWRCDVITSWRGFALLH